jgi:protein gp37
MNDVKKTIGWCDKTWNPFTGCTLHCSYCYAEAMAKRFGKYKTKDDAEFRPRWHLERFDEPKKLKKPSRIFCVSAGDLFCYQENYSRINGAYFIDQGPMTHWQAIIRLFDIMRNCPQHQFYICTKGERIFYEYLFRDPGSGWPSNLMLGFSVTPSMDWGIINTIKEAIPVFLNYEPLIWTTEEYREFHFNNIKWIIIGGLSGNSSYQADPRTVADLLTLAKAKNIPVYMKDNLKGWEGQLRKEHHVANNQN